MTTLVVLLLVPFIQLGLSYYVSVASAVALLVLYKWRRPALNAALTNIHLWLIVAMMFLSLIGYSSSDQLRDIFRIGREGLVFFFMMSLVSANAFRSTIDVSSLLKPLLAVSSALLILTIIQQIFYSRGTYFGIPQSWFSTDAGTLPGELDLYFSDLRPSGPFQEPSYLGFILISIILIILPLVRQLRGAQAIALIILITGVMSRSLAFLLSASLITPWPLLRSANLERKIKVWTAMGIGAIVILLATSGGEVLGRLLQGAQAYGDTSTFGRMFLPLFAMPKYLLEYPLGVPFYGMPVALSPFVSNSLYESTEAIHNGLANLFFEFGVVGFLIIAVLLRNARDNAIRCYLLAAASFNGAFLSFDKFGIVVFAVAGYRSALNWVETQGCKVG